MEDNTALEAEQADQELHDNLHSELDLQIRQLSHRRDVLEGSQALHKEMTSLSLLKDITDPYFKRQFSGFQSRVSKLAIMASDDGDHEEIPALVKPLNEGVDHLMIEMETARRLAKDKASPCFSTCCRPCQTCCSSSITQR